MIKIWNKLFKNEKSKINSTIPKKEIPASEQKEATAKSLIESVDYAEFEEKYIFNEPRTLKERMERANQKETQE